MTTRAKPTTLGAAASLYLQNLPKAGPAAQQELGSVLRYFGWQYQLSQITPRDVESYSSQITANAESAPRRIKILKDFFSFVVQQAELSVSLAPHIKPRRVGKVQSTDASKKHPREHAQLTREGHATLQAKLTELKEEIVKNSDDIKKAAADKDFRENSPLEAARQQQGFLMGQLRSIEATLEGAEILNANNRSGRSKIRQGSRVILQETVSGKELSYFLVDPQEVNPQEGKISTASPVGRALIDKRVGDEVAVSSPRGTVKYRVARIE